MVDVVHVCPRGHTRSSGYCGACQHPTSPLCGGCGHDLTQPGHEDH